MRISRRDGPVALALTLALLTSSCGILSSVFLRKKPITRNGKPVATKLMVASRDELVSRVARIYDAIHSFQATVDMTGSVGSVYKGEITEFPDVRAFVFFRKPADIRIQALLPVVRTQAFDMVSNGTDFRFYLNNKNIFYIGSDNAPPVPKKGLENLRPTAFLSSMLVRPPDAEETPVMTDLTDSENALYILTLILKLPGGDLRASRQVWFDRVDLTIRRQLVFDPAGAIVSDTVYNKWQSYNGVAFPSHIDISRPVDGYGVVLDVVKMDMNKALTDADFLLTQPEGSQLQVIGAPKQDKH